MITNIWLTLRDYKFRKLEVTHMTFNYEGWMKLKREIRQKNLLTFGPDAGDITLLGIPCHLCLKQEEEYIIHTKE